ncbi:MAG: YbaK/EbsC family protein [Anaerolineae bacterium]|mgnify:CR=1 FL=1|jgi:prolyl-tRNA editing enzyme YbaK/EbsC (Cys-tRNA(Pro) deacylase)|nr:YbaK/EbsC family protein [Anaerolineae bacterium]MBT7070372.1 YbaK/EbsC family protein [Anaerolineae bacterium]MBT7324414.1 YbaK/EbsC family protein [Anaerolineae bacterium]
MPLSSSAQKVQDALKNLGYHYEVIEDSESTRTAEEAAARVGCEVGQIVKSLIFQGKKSGKAILILTSGANRVDVKRIKVHAEEKIGRADPAFVRERTGFAIGGIPPLGHLHPIETYLDEDLLRFEDVWAAGGTPNAVFKMDAKELEKMTGGKVIIVK